MAGDLKCRDCKVEIFRSVAALGVIVVGKIKGSMKNNGFEILQFSLCEGWINNLYDSNDNPYIFSTLEEAIAELQEEFDDWQSEIENGEREEEDGYDIFTFQIICNKIGIAYALDLVAGKVVIIHGTTNN
jgi:hypothetical protein